MRVHKCFPIVCLMHTHTLGIVRLCKMHATVLGCTQPSRAKNVKRKQQQCISHCDIVGGIFYGSTVFSLILIQSLVGFGSLKSDASVRKYQIFFSPLLLFSLVGLINIHRRKKQNSNKMYTIVANAPIQRQINRIMLGA